MGAPTTDIEGDGRPVDIPGVGFEGVGQGYDMGAYEMLRVWHVDKNPPTTGYRV